MYTYLIIKNNEYALWIILRESMLVVLNSYITIFSIIKYQKVTYNGRVKTIFFWLHSYRATFGYAREPKLYFTHFYSYFSSSLLLFVHSQFFYSFFFLFLYNIHTAIYYLCIHTVIVLLFLYFIFSYILFFYLCIHIAIVVDNIILL